MPVLFALLSYLASCRCRRRAFLRSGHSSRDPGCHSCPCSKGCCRLLPSSTPHTHSTLDPRQSSPCCICRGLNSCLDKSLSWGRQSWGGRQGSSSKVTQHHRHREHLTLTGQILLWLSDTVDASWKSYWSSSWQVVQTTTKLWPLAYSNICTW